MIRRLMIFIFLLCPLTAPAAEKLPVTETAVHDRAEAELLLGRHWFASRLTSIDAGFPYTYFGKAIVTEESGLYKISGYHEHYHTPYRPADERQRSGGYVKVEGVITEIQKDYFIFDGLIETGMVDSLIKEGKIKKSDLDICTRPRRLYKFSREKHPTYWRFQTPVAPDYCNRDSTEDIDLFIKRPND